MTNNIPYLVSGLTAASSFVAQMQPSPGSWHSIAIQAGMAGVVVLLLLKFFPMILSSMRAEADANRAVVREIIESNRTKDLAWQQIINDRTLCPKDKTGN